jgi:hypothetical protein
MMKRPMRGLIMTLVTQYETSVGQPLTGSLSQAEALVSPGVFMFMQINHALPGLIQSMATSFQTSQHRCVSW